MNGKLVHSKKVISAEGPDPGRGSWGTMLEPGGGGVRWETTSVPFPAGAQRGDGFVDEVKLRKIVAAINEEFKTRFPVIGQS